MIDVLRGQAYRHWSAFIHKFNYHHMKPRYPLDQTGRVVADAHCDWCGMTAKLPPSTEELIAKMKERRLSEPSK